MEETCKGITKKRTRCKNFRNLSDGFCVLHADQKNTVVNTDIANDIGEKEVVVSVSVVKIDETDKSAVYNKVSPKKNIDCQTSICSQKESAKIMVSIVLVVTGIIALLLVRRR